jgi:isoleucyl-tRNA synthetase
MELVREVVSLGHAARKESKVKVRQPLPKLQFRGSAAAAWKDVKVFEDIIKDEINVKGIEEILSIEELIEYKTKPMFAKLGPKFGPQGKAVATAISAMNSSEAKAFKERGFAKLIVDGAEIEIIPEDADVSVQSKPGIMVKVERDFAIVLDTALSPELLEEGNARELVHTIQNLRKTSGFDVADRISVRFEAGGPIVGAVQKHGDYIRNETLAVELIVGALSASDKSEEADVNGFKVTLQLRRA